MTYHVDVTSRSVLTSVFLGAVTAAVLDEANVAFELNTALFDDLKAPSGASTPPSPVDIPSPLRSPVVPSSNLLGEDVGHDTALLVAIKNRGESKVVYESAPPSAAEWYYRATSVIAFIVAVSIAHFALVVGGFTGAKGYAKLEALQQWLDNYFSSATSA